MDGVYLTPSLKGIKLISVTGNILLISEMRYSTLAIRTIVLDKNLHFFSVKELAPLLSMSSLNCLYCLERGVMEGLFVQLRRGLYCLKTDMPSEQEIANQLYRPSYVSFEYALAYYNLIPEMTYTITSATTKPTRKFEVLGKVYEYTSIKLPVYTGYESREIDGQKFQIAEPEKAIADYLYLVSLGRRADNDRLNLDTVDKQKVKNYLELFKRPSLLSYVE